MTFDEYCISIGVQTHPPSFAELHKTSKNVSMIAKKRALARMAQANAEWQAQRDDTRKDYNHLVSTGAIQLQDRTEFIKIIASGHPDNAATQAAKRLLERRNIP